MSLVLDTHTVLWYLEGSQELTSIARTAIENAIGDARDVHISAISLKIVYLVERRRLPLTAIQRLQSVLIDPKSGILVASVDANVANALQNVLRDAVPDMPNRIIAATVLHLGFPLITRDRRLQSAGIETIW